MGRLQCDIAAPLACARAAKELPNGPFPWSPADALGPCSPLSPSPRSRAADPLRGRRRRPRSRGDAAAGDPDPLRRRFQGRAPGTPGEERTSPSCRRNSARGPPARQSTAAGTRTCRWSRSPLHGSPPLEIAGAGRGLKLRLSDRLRRRRLPAQPHVAVDNSEIVFVGYGINAPERGWNDYEGLDVRGKTVVILVNDPDCQTAGPDRPVRRPGDDLLRPLDLQVRGGGAARRRRRAHRPRHRAGLLRLERGREQLDRARSSTCRAPNDGADQTAVNGWLTNEAARRLLAAAGQDLDALTRAAQHAASVPCRSASPPRSARQPDRRAASRNVIGVLPGRTHPDEYVIYTAHWDHLGAVPRDGDDHLQRRGRQRQRHLRSGRPRRSPCARRAARPDDHLPCRHRRGIGPARFGLLCRQPDLPARATAGGFNMDSLNLAGAARDFVSIGGGKSELDAYLARAAAAGRHQGLGRADARGRLLFPLRSVQLRQAGVPMLYGRGGEDLVTGGPAAGRAAAEDYRANRYHGVTTNMIPPGTGPARSATSASITGSAARWRRRATGRTGSRRRIPRHPRPLARGAIRQPITYRPSDFHSCPPDLARRLSRDHNRIPG